MQSPESTDDALSRNRDVNIRGVLVFGFSLALGTIFVSLAMWGLFRLLAREERVAEKPLPPAVAASLRRTPPEPRLPGCGGRRVCLRASRRRKVE